VIPIRPVTLADVGTSAGAALGVPDMVDRLALGPARHVVVCLIDGLGWQALRGHLAEAPLLASMHGAPIDAAFPTTTPVGLGSLGTGLLAGQHGLVGAAFELPESGEVLTPLQWGHHPTPVAVQPEPTVFERVERHGVRVTTLSPAAYAHSGLTRAVLRGATYVGCEDASGRVDRLESLLASPEPSFTYVYWPELDRVGHESGVASDAWRAALTRVDRLVDRLCSVLVPGSILIVTSDHGMVDCPPDRRVVLEAHAELARGVRRWAGEPRVRHVYTESGALTDVLQTWTGVLSDRADVLTRAEVIERGLLGPVDDLLEARIGDLVVLARGNVALASSVDRTVSSLLGQHGGLTPDELLIPALVTRT
jgi:Type I phosphodiesterase / nucleotide pyrophosphatase